MTLVDCIERNYLKVLLWTKYREMIIAREIQEREEENKRNSRPLSEGSPSLPTANGKKEDSSSVNLQRTSMIVCYETFLSLSSSSSGSSIHSELLQIYQKLHFSLLNETALDHIISTNSASQFFQKNDTSSTKLRQGGKSHFTSFSLYHLPLKVISWMNVTYWSLEKEVYESPCSFARKNKGLE
jgi:hypothetical protein